MQPSTQSRINANYGQCETDTVYLKPGWSYEVRLFHSGTKPGETTDYDYTLRVVGDLPANVILVDDDSLLGEDNASTYFAGAGKAAIFKVVKASLMFCNQEDGDWSELETSRVVLDDEKLKIKISVSPKLDSKAQCIDALGGSLILKTAGTCPSGVAIPLVLDAEWDNSDPVCSMLKITKTVSQLKTLGLLPTQDEDGIDEMAWLDKVSTEGQSSVDSEAFSTLGYEFRGKAVTDLPVNLYSDLPNSFASLSFFKSGGCEIVQALYGSCEAPRVQIMNQADVFYYSGHGSGATGELDGGFFPDTPGTMWNRDLNCVVMAGCSVLNIAGHRIKSFGLSTRFKRWVYGHFDNSVGALWEGHGDVVLLGYCYTAPLDSNGSDGIARTFAAKVRSGMGYIQAWKEANDIDNGRNACAIDCTATPHKFWFWDETSGAPVWTAVSKGDESW